MSALTFKLREAPPERLNLSGLTPQALAGLSRPEIERLGIGTTKRGLLVGDVFDLSGEAGETLAFAGTTGRCDRIGEALVGGAIHVEGDCGTRLGRAMRGGTIAVSGSAGSHAGSGMSGGRIEISGSAGDFLGGPLAGETAGMTGGFLKVAGDCGARAGDRMRRGTIVVSGAAGPDAGSRMIAGTVIVGRRAAGTPGRLMKRGTLILAGGAERLVSTFLDNGVCDLLILTLMARDLEAAGLGPLPFDGAPMRRFGGDTAVTGLGEIFVPQA
ncbi:formylmethanofuran dehydrogenase subunit C [Aurantimonas sp. Leaf443]|uniref:formylmethanofuran dehydrogenase subunit C n=1 Tax=Aurantimonas sp. Leaf443 TaxID=1736378 RepID=UPI0006F7069D|nr:formylmethanofuran dehydrogenase subunit C [Aurantimonas sp. Leaf443]KQT85218.1 formylmethanofuran dehydrogenase subunit C [Aurantimonas sp. Leaf443]